MVRVPVFLAGFVLPHQIPAVLIALVPLFQPLGDGRGQSAPLQPPGRRRSWPDKGGRSGWLWRTRPRRCIGSGRPRPPAVSRRGDLPCPRSLHPHALFDDVLGLFHGLHLRRVVCGLRPPVHARLPYVGRHVADPVFPVVAHLGPLLVCVMGAQRLGPLRPFLRRIGNAHPQAHRRVRRPVCLRRVRLQALIQFSVRIAPDLPGGVVDG